MSHGSETIFNVFSDPAMYKNIRYSNSQLTVTMTLERPIYIMLRGTAVINATTYMHRITASATETEIYKSDVKGTLTTKVIIKWRNLLSMTGALCRQIQQR